MEDIKTELWSKADEILEPHISGHPITYNHYLTDNLQKARAKRRRFQLEKKLKLLFGVDEIQAGVRVTRDVDVKAILDELAGGTEPDMDVYSSSMAIDTMEAYYKVCREHNNAIRSSFANP